MNFNLKLNYWNVTNYRFYCKNLNTVAPVNFSWPLDFRLQPLPEQILTKSISWPFEVVLLTQQLTQS